MHVNIHVSYVLTSARVSVCKSVRHSVHTCKTRACNFRVSISVGDCTLSFLHIEPCATPCPSLRTLNSRTKLQDPKCPSNNDDDDTLSGEHVDYLCERNCSRRLNHENVSVLGMRDPLIPPEEENTFSSRFSRPRKRNYCIVLKRRRRETTLMPENTRFVPKVEKNSILLLVPSKFTAIGSTW